jgi:putative membrane protein insertion efficiency factor
MKLWYLLYRDIPAWLMITAVRGYQLTLSPFIGRECRFYPTCSHYFILAVRKYGPWRGACKGLWRICRCNPFHPGGEDWP